MGVGPPRWLGCCLLWAPGSGREAFRRPDPLEGSCWVPAPAAPWDSGGGQCCLDYCFHDPTGLGSVGGQGPWHPCGGSLEHPAHCQSQPWGREGEQGPCGLPWLFGATAEFRGHSCSSGDHHTGAGTPFVEPLHYASLLFFILILGHSWECSGLTPAVRWGPLGCWGSSLG